MGNKKCKLNILIITLNASSSSHVYSMFTESVYKFVVQYLPYYLQLYKHAENTV